MPLLKTAVVDADRDRQADVDPRGLAGRADVIHAVLLDVLGLGVLHRRRERHRQERVRARPDRPRPSPGRRRHRRSAAPRGDDPDRHLPRADPPSHGAARARRHQRQGAVRHRVDALVEARRAGRAARTLGAGTRVRAARPRRRVLRDARAARAAHPDAGGARAATSRSSSKWPRATSCCAHAAITPRGSSPRASTTRCSAPNQPWSSATRMRTMTRPNTRETAVKRRRSRRAARSAARAGRQPFIILTGLSGSGKSQAIRALEDLGYFCVDNLPTTLIPTLAQAGHRAAATSKRSRSSSTCASGNFLSSFPAVFARLRKMRGLNPVLIFLEASNERAGPALQRDAAAASAGAASESVSEGIRDERARHDRHPRDGRRDRRHVGHDRPRAAPVLHGAVARPVARAAGRHASELRLQVRRAGRRRPGVRRPLPAEPALRAGAAAADRPRSGGRRVHGARAVDARVHRRLEEYLQFVAAVLRRRRARAT